jgi:DNA invertase Pin-like site-specific DNA recombinase
MFCTVSGGLTYAFRVNSITTGYARCSTDLQDLTAQREILLGLGVPEDRIYLDKGLTGTNRGRPGLGQALAAVRAGDTLVVPKLDRLARSVPDARDIGDSLVARGVRLSLGDTIYDPADPMGKMFFNILATFAEFEVDLLKMRTREGMAVARAKGKLKGKQPKLSARQQAELCRMHATDEYTIADLAEVSSNEPRRPRAPDPRALILRWCRSEISDQSFPLATRTPDDTRHAGTNQAERSGSDLSRDACFHINAAQRHIHWIFRQDYWHPKIARALGVSRVSVYGADAVAVRVGACDLDLVRRRPAVRLYSPGRDRMPRLRGCTTMASSTGPSIWSPSRSWRAGRLCSLSAWAKATGRGSARAEVPPSRP